MEPEEIIHALRKEIQIDRIELQRTIAEGFDKISDKFDEHAKSDNTQFSEIDTRLTAIETKATTVGKAVWSLFITFVAAAVSYGFSFLIHPNK